MSGQDEPLDERRASFRRPQRVRLDTLLGMLQTTGLTFFKCPVQNERIKYGYARVSTDDQNPALQLAALEKAGCQTVFRDEGLPGATTKRPALLRCLKKLEHGDTLISGSSTDSTPAHAT